MNGAFRLNGARRWQGPVLFASFLGYCAFALAQAPAGSNDADILRALSPEFSDPVLLTMDDLTVEQARKVSTTPGIGRRFEGDFNDDGRRDLALFGQHSRGDSVSTFLLIASMRGDGWHRAGLLEFPSDFAIGVEYPNVDYVLWVGFCTGCDFGQRVVWSGSGYETMPYQPIGVEP